MININNFVFKNSKINFYKFDKNLKSRFEIIIQKKF